MLMANTQGRLGLHRSRLAPLLLLLTTIPLSLFIVIGTLYVVQPEVLWGPQHRSAAGALLTQHDAVENKSPKAVGRKAELERLWGIQWSYSGISTFAHLKHVSCLTEPDTPFDIGIIGAPFDTAVSYRTGARFGPRAIRTASARQSRSRGWNPRAHINPYKSGLTVLDCGDIPLMPLDNGVALRQMTQAMTELGSRPSARRGTGQQGPPRLLTLGGDHSVALGALRALRQIHGQPLTVVHFDAHLDTWIPPASAEQFPWFSEQGRFNHGDVFTFAWDEGLIANGSSVHVGLRTRLSGPEDNDDDARQGFAQIGADEVDSIGVEGIVDKVKARVGHGPVYLSFDIDVVDPGLAPGTGTPEVGGFTSREVIRMLRGLEGLDVVGADIVEVNPAYDGPGEQTALVAAQVAFEILTNWAKAGGSSKEG
ncbi:arginase family protein [Hirsutella rhossiliensis]|uniref:Arginase family domain-containing protein n=1 Tax=Hirsutella rhossiliensis TaxID=111463 RepID=A0A9P8SKT1_9HYPO|nr:arginase family domain-containing protein [Hirsutella rhossiliensis]KAH0965554.1 arginase family domain-containing protein [Hirsutella rhossiliensis]